MAHTGWKRQYGRHGDNHPVQRPGRCHQVRRRGHRWQLRGSCPRTVERASGRHEHLLVQHRPHRCPLPRRRVSGCGNSRHCLSDLVFAISRIRSDQPGARLRQRRPAHRHRVGGRRQPDHRAATIPDSLQPSTTPAIQTTNCFSHTAAVTPPIRMPTPPLSWSMETT